MESTTDTEEGIPRLKARLRAKTNLDCHPASPLLAKHHDASDDTGTNHFFSNITDAPQLSAECLRLEFGATKEKATKTKLVTVAIHGDEVAPLIAVNQLLREHFFEAKEDLSEPIENGKDPIDDNHEYLGTPTQTRKRALPKRILENERIVLVLGNPRALEQNRRFADVNLNRIFLDELMAKDESDIFYKATYEMSRLHDIIEAIRDCDEYIDMHSTSSASPPFAIAGDCYESRELAMSFPVAFVIEDLSKVIKGTTIDLAHRLGKKCCCIETGQHTDPHTIEIAKDVIINFLSDDRAQKAEKVLTCHSSQELKKGFKFMKQVAAFQQVDYDELVACDDHGEIRCPHQCGAFIIMPTSNPVLGEEAWFWGINKPELSHEAKPSTFGAPIVRKSSVVDIHPIVSNGKRFQIQEHGVEETQVELSPSSHTPHTSH